MEGVEAFGGEKESRLTVGEDSRRYRLKSDAPRSDGEVTSTQLKRREGEQHRRKEKKEGKRTRKIQPRSNPVPKKTYFDQENHLQHFPFFSSVEILGLRILLMENE